MGQNLHEGSLDQDSKAFRTHDHQSWCKSFLETSPLRTRALPSLQVQIADCCPKISPRLAKRRRIAARGSRITSPHEATRKHTTLHYLPLYASRILSQCVSLDSTAPPALRRGWAVSTGSLRTYTRLQQTRGSVLPTSWGMFCLYHPAGLSLSLSSSLSRNHSLSIHSATRWSMIGTGGR